VTPFGGERSNPAAKTAFFTGMTGLGGGMAQNLKKKQKDRGAGKTRRGKNLSAS